uniref:CAAX prenyl protease n=1 Tax=Strongyloides papillosus TaxID=174720 RepID=A0A0N5BHY2_STREA
MSQALFYGIFAFQWLIYIWETYLSWRQYRVHLLTEKRPKNAEKIMEESEYTKARLYKLDKHRFEFCQSAFSHILNCLILWYEILPLMWNISGDVNKKIGITSEMGQSLMFQTINSLLTFVTALPFSYYDTFIIEQKHGFNKQTLPFFIKDKIKGLVVGLVIMIPVIAAVIWIVENSGEYLFVYAWIFVSIIVFLLMTIYPEFIAPLFDKYTPLPDGELKTKIENLAKSVSYPLTKLYVVQGSKRSSHSNAYMYGFWKNKRIVLFDTLLSAEENEKLKAILAEENKDKKKEGTEEDTLKEEEEEDKDRKNKGMTNDEVVAVLGHELGHWALMHTVINLIVMEVNLFFLFFVFAYFYRWSAIYEAFGFSTQPTIIGLIVVFQFITAPYNELVEFLMIWYTRKMEFQADEYSFNLGYGDLLCTSLIKLGKDNLSLPVDDPLYASFHHSHPSIIHRIERINLLKDKGKKSD